MIIGETELKVRYVETDQMGIVHHSNYYAWFEVGRTEFTKLCDMTYSYMEIQGIMMPVIESSCKYIEGAKYEDEIIIKTWIENLGRARVTFKYDVVRKMDNKLLAQGSTSHAFVGDNFRVVNLKKKKPEIWEKLIKAL